MEGSFAKWNVLRAAYPCFRIGTLNGWVEAESISALKRRRLDSRATELPRSGLVQIAYIVECSRAAILARGPDFPVAFVVPAASLVRREYAIRKSCAGDRGVLASSRDDHTVLLYLSFLR